MLVDFAATLGVKKRDNPHHLSFARTARIPRVFDPMNPSQWEMHEYF
jgi:hypothetical protein